MKPTPLYVEVVKCPLDNAETVEDIENYSFPNPYAPGRFEKAIKDYFVSDGAVVPLIDDFIEIGVNVYSPIQPNVAGSDPKELKNKFGDRICFFGGIDQYSLLPSGDVDKISQEIRQRIQILGKDRGYLLAPAHILQADVSTRIVKEMTKAAFKYGNY